MEWDFVYANTDIISVYLNETFVINISVDSASGSIGYISYNHTAHSTVNASFRGYNTTSGSISSWLNQTTTIENRAPIISTQDSVEEYTVNATEPITITILNEDYDLDLLTNSTNATKGSYNISTGVYSWTPTVSDVGEHIISFSSLDDFDNSIVYSMLQ